MGDFSVAELSLGNLGKAQKADAVTVSHDGYSASSETRSATYLNTLGR